MEPRTLTVKIMADGSVAVSELESVGKAGNQAAGGTAESWTTSFSTIATGVNQARQLISAAWGEVSALVERGTADNKAEEDSVISLTTALEAHGHAVDANVEASRRYADEAMKRFAIDDDEILKIEAIAASYGLAGRDIQTFADDVIATHERTGKSVEASEMIVEKAMGGQVKSYHALGIEIDTTGTKSDVLAQLHTKLAGSMEAAEQKAQGYEGQLKLLNDQEDNLLGSMSKLITQNPDTLAMLSGLSSAVGDLTTDIDNWRGGMVSAADQGKHTAMTIHAEFDDMAANVVESVAVVGAAVKDIFDGVAIGFDWLLKTSGDALLSLGDAGNKIRGFFGRDAMDLSGIRDFRDTMAGALLITQQDIAANQEAATKASAFALELRNQAEAARQGLASTSDLTAAINDQSSAIGGDEGAGGDLAKAPKAGKGGGKGLVGSIEDLTGKYNSLAAAQRDVKQSTVDNLFKPASADKMQDYTQGLLDQLMGGGMSQGSATSFIDSLGLPTPDRQGTEPVGRASGSDDPWGAYSDNSYDYGTGGGSGYGMIAPRFSQGGRNTNGGPYDPSKYPGSQSRGPWDFSGPPGIQELLQYYAAIGLITESQKLGHMVDPNQGNYYANYSGAHDLVPFGSLGTSPDKPLYMTLVGGSAALAENAIGSAR